MVKLAHSRYILDNDTHTAAGGLPVYSISEIADYEINGYWASIGSPNRNWAVDHHTITYNLDAIDADRRPLARLAMASWAELTGLTFKAVSGTADITFTETGSKTAVTNVTYSGHSLLSAVVNVSADWSNTAAMDSYLMQTFVHELGHALGLGHTGPYNGNATYGTDNIFVNDTEQYSVMSYMQQHNYGGASDRFVMTAQMADIFAIQEIYGAGTARAGDTTYGFHAAGQQKATAAIYDFSKYDTAPALTIYDSGGKDTLDCSGYAQKQTIDLVGGTWSDIGGLHGNIGIYETSVIENAVGGKRQDNMIGNDADNRLKGMGGADKLSGGLGDDTLVGGAKGDTFAFRAGWANDTIIGFTSGSDRIDLKAFGFASFTDEQAIAADSTTGHNLVLDFGSGDTLTIHNFSKADLAIHDVLI